jgi:hypothetical protein
MNIVRPDGLSAIFLLLGPYRQFLQENPNLFKKLVYKLNSTTLNSVVNNVFGQQTVGPYIILSSLHNATLLKEEPELPRKLLEKLNKITLNMVMPIGDTQYSSIVLVLLCYENGEAYLKKNPDLLLTLLEKLEDATLNSIVTAGDLQGTSIVFKMLTTEVGKACLKENPELLNQLLEKLDEKTLDAETLDGKSIRSVLNMEKKITENEKIQYNNFLITNINNIERKMNVKITEDIKENSNTPSNN